PDAADQGARVRAGCGRVARRHVHTCGDGPGDDAADGAMELVASLLAGPVAAEGLSGDGRRGSRGADAGARLTVEHGQLVAEWPVSRRKDNTAITRRWTSVSSVNPSLWKRELMCFSTARSVRNRSLAMAALFWPWAMWVRTSCSRSVSCPSGDRAARSLRDTNPSTTLGSRTDPPRATSCRARTSSSTSATRSLSR